MALYHLSLKVNKHNTKTVKGKDHADYINREGKFKDVDEKNILKTQTFTSKNEIKLITTENLSGKVNKLYINSSGSIIQKGDSLKITDNASEETVQLALALAKRISVTDKIDISGSDDFKDKVSKSIVEMNYVDNVNIVNDEVNNKIKNIQKEYEADGKELVNITKNVKIDTEYLSPTLNSLKKTQYVNLIPKMSLACKMCPHGIWMFNSQVLGCFCRILHQMVWTSKKPTNINLCDGMYLEE